MGEVCVERRIECLVDDEWRAGRIAVMQPELDGEDWRCELDLDWPGYKKSYPVMGVDAYQALELALRIVPVEIMASERFRRGQLRHSIKIGFRVVAHWRYISLVFLVL